MNVYVCVCVCLYACNCCVTTTVTHDESLSLLSLSVSLLTHITHRQNSLSLWNIKLIMSYYQHFSTKTAVSSPYTHTQHARTHTHTPLLQPHFISNIQVRLSEFFKSLRFSSPSLAHPHKHAHTHTHTHSLKQKTTTKTINILKNSNIALSLASLSHTHIYTYTYTYIHTHIQKVYHFDC